MKKKDVLIISTADWDSPIQTNKQYVAKEMAKLGYRILYVESLGIRKIKPKKEDFKRIFKRLRRFIKPSSEVEHNIYVVSHILIPGAENKLTILINRILFNLKLNYAMILLNFSKDLLWTYNPLTCNYLNLKNFKYTVYHAVDAIENQPYMPKDLIIYNQEILLTQVNKIFVTSKNLLKKLRIFNKNISYYGNVCDYIHFSKSLTLKDKNIPKDILSIKRPIVGFIGSISEYKLDYDLILKVSKRLENLSFVFIGPTSDIIDESKLNKLLLQKNIFMMGYRKYEELPNYCACFDIGWLPLIKNKYTKSMFPIKFYEYLAAGLPVIATSIDSLKEFDDVAYISENNSKIISRNIEFALDNKGPELELRLAKARKNTYEIRTKRMLNEINF